MNHKKVYYLFLIFTFCCFSITQLYAQENKKKEKNAVNSRTVINIDGVPLAVMIKGTNKNNPILLFIHGGPGFPFFPFLREHIVFNKLEKYFTLVYWEQRGTGKSYSKKIPPHTMNIEQFIEDTHLIVNFALTFLKQKKLFIWAHSWGTNIGAIYASRYPENLYAYIATGQSVNPIKNEQLGYDFVLKKAIADNNKRALKQLAKIDTSVANYKLEHALILRKWIHRYGGVVKQEKLERPYVDFHDIYVILTTPFYSLSDKIALIRHPYYSAENLWDDLKKLNLYNEVKKIDVPVFFLIGAYDVLVSKDLSADFFEKLEAPKGKKLIWFENSAHRPFIEENEKFMQVFLNEILPIYYKQNNLEPNIENLKEK